MSLGESAEVGRLFRSSTPELGYWLMSMMFLWITERSEIRRRRKRLGLSQEKLGEMVGLSQKQISRIENYGTDSLWKVKNIAAVFGITIDELMGEDRQVQTVA